MPGKNGLVDSTLNGTTISHRKGKGKLSTQKCRKMGKGYVACQEGIVFLEALYIKWVLKKAIEETYNPERRKTTFKRGHFRRKVVFLPSFFKASVSFRGSNSQN